MDWYELQPPTLELGRTYKTLGGTEVRMVSISNAGKEYETMVDEEGVHRYSRSHGRIIGRCTGSDKDDPLNILFERPATPQAAPAVAADELADKLCWWVNNTSGLPDDLLVSAATELRRRSPWRP